MIKEAKKTYVSKPEQRRRQVAAAMPDVKAAVEKYGLSVVHSCVARLRENDKTQRKAQELRAEADALSQKLREEADQLERSLKSKAS